MNSFFEKLKPLFEKTKPFFEKIKPFTERFSRRTWIIVGAVAVILLIVIIVRSRNATKTTYETAPVERGNLVATIGATGSVRAQQSATLLWQTTGRVEIVNASVGKNVKKDDVLAALSKTSLSQNVIAAEADLVNAQKTLDDLLNSDTARAQAARTLSAAETAYQNAYDYRISLNGKITITDVYLRFGVPIVRSYKGYAGADTIATADEKLALAKAQLDDARRNLARLSAGADSADVAAAKARVAAAQATINTGRIVAPFDGTVTQALPSVGDQIAMNAPAFRLDNVSHLLVDLLVSEVDINSIKTGQPATLTFDAVLNHEYHGQVIGAGQAGDIVQGVVNFIVTVQLTDADARVKPGMTTAVSVVTEEHKDVLLIPNRAVRLVNKERVVYLLVNGKAQKVKVQLGASDGTNSELRGGEVKEGDPLILNPPSTNNGPFGG